MSAPNAVSVVIYGDDQTQAAIQSVNTNLVEMKRRGEQSMGSLRTETREAKAGMAALGEEIGIAIPRHLRTALAEFDVLRKVFAGAAFGLELGLGIEIIEKLPEKIHKISDAIVGWGESAQKAYEDQLKLNEALTKAAEEAEKINRDASLLGLAGSAKDRAEARQLQEDIDKLTGSINAQTEARQRLKQVAAQEQTVMTQGSPGLPGAMTPSTTPTAAALDAQKMLEESQDAYNKGINDSNGKLEVLRANLAKVGKETQLAYGDEAKKQAEEFIQTVLQGWKNIADVQQGIHERDASAAAMMKLLAGDGKILANALNIASAAVKGPFDDMERLGGRIKDVLTEVEAETQRVKTAEENLSTSTIEGDKEINAIREKARAQLQGMVADYKALAKASGDPKLIQNANEYEKKLEQIKAVLDSVRTEALHKLTQDTENFFAGFLDGSKTGAAAFADFGKAILATLAQIEAKYLAIWIISKALHWITEAFSGGADAAAGGLGEGNDEANFVSGIGHSAGGGSWGAGDWSWVGEQGPELVRFGAAATVIPHSASMAMASSGGGNTVNIDARGAQAGVSQEITNAIRLSEERAVARATIQMREIQRRRA